MSEKEKNARWMAEQLQKLPEKVQERIGYMIDGARLVHDDREDEPDDDMQKGA